MAFGPLEAALNRHDPTKPWSLEAGLWFCVGGLVLYSIALALEWRFVDAE
jgi:hypothetical protein